MNMKEPASFILAISFGFELDITNSMGNIKKYLESGFMTGVRLDEYYDNKYSGNTYEECVGIWANCW